MTVCQQVIYAATYDPPQPAETCDRDVVDGTDYCPTHLGMADMLDGADL